MTIADALLKVGLGITTYNRAPILSRTLDRVAQFTRSPVEIVVADDGSTDGTVEMLRARGVQTIAGKNRGIAWNKNRAIFYLNNIIRCDVVILLEDDTSPLEDGWNTPWETAAVEWGHANFAGGWFSHAFKGGAGTINDPIISPAISGQCASFSRVALETVGFMDTRFGRYGFEHAEHSERMVRAGFGGCADPDNPGGHLFWLLPSPLEVSCGDQPVDHAAIAQNAPIYDQVRREGIHRWAWRSDEERSVLQSELRECAPEFFLCPEPDSMGQ